VDVDIANPQVDGNSCNGAATYTIKVFDACGNMNSACSFVIGLNDLTPPMVVGACPTAAQLGLPSTVTCNTLLPTAAQATAAFNTSQWIQLLFR
jgi:hypothetical protein